MTVIIKKYTDKESIRKLISKLQKRTKFDAHKFCGVLKLRQSPLEIQKKMRDEW